MSEAEPSAEPEPMLCPTCGYDLRASTGERCSECGTIIDHLAMRSTGFPWPRRREIGRLRAFIATVWQVTFRPGKLRFEPSRTHNAAEARWFRWVIGALLVPVCLAIYLVVAQKGGPIDELLATPDPLFAPAAGPNPMIDLEVPWSAGASIPGVLPLLVTLWAFRFTAHRALFRIRGATGATGRVRLP